MSKSILFVCLGDWDSTQCLRARCFGDFLKNAGWEVHYLLNETAVNRTVSGNNIRVIENEITTYTYKSRRHIRTVKPDYVHYLNPDVRAFLLTFCGSQTKVVGDWEDWHAISRDKGIRYQVNQLIDYFMRRRADAVIVTSLWLKDAFSKICRNAPVYIPYADLPMAMPELPDPYSEPTFVWMGSFRQHMDYDLVLSTIRELKQRGRSPRFEMIGKGPCWEEAKKFRETHQLDNLSLPGFLEWEDMLNRLCWAHALLFPIRDNVNNRARCPFKVFQYAKAKRPIVTNRVGEVPTFLGEKAHYVDCNPVSFADALMDYLDRPRIDTVDYEIEKQTWEDRGRRLVEALT